MKAKITTAAGSFEFEGTEEWVEKQIANVMNISATMKPQVEEKTKKKATSTKKASSSAKKSVSDQPKMLPTLIEGKEEVDSLREFYERKQPATQIESFAVLMLWLKSNKDMDDVSVDEMWTLYKFLNIRAPKALIQTFRDGKSKKGYFESSDSAGRYFITSFGETFVEHDLPANKGKKA